MELPSCICKSQKLARVGYSTVKANEYLDSAINLKKKVKILAQMIKDSKNTVVYTGAGISTAAGIGDYASVGEKSIVRKNAGSGSRLTFVPLLHTTVWLHLRKGGIFRSGCSKTMMALHKRQVIHLRN